MNNMDKPTQNVHSPGNQVSEGSGQQPIRRRYRTPQIIVWGDFADLTKGGGGTSDDNPGGYSMTV